MDIETLMLLKKAVAINAQLEEAKKLYAQMDEVISQLIEKQFTSGSIEGFQVQLVDNFEKKNVVFRPAGVRRYEIKIS